MSMLTNETESPYQMGMASMVVGTIGLLLFFMPILGIPISAFGLLFGLLGIAVALVWAGQRVRWIALGCVVSAMALAINLLIADAPVGYLAAPTVPPLWQRAPDRPYVAPPAPPEGQERSVRQRSTGNAGSGEAK